MNSKLNVEVCVDSVDSAVAAERGGAHRVELCVDLLEGGTTPSAGLIAEVRRNISIKLHVMIRPRGSDFCYAGSEFAVMQEDIATAKERGADGVVFGVLHPDGTVDAARMRKLADLARPMKTTCHRAIDMSRDLLESLETLAGLGIDYILTSGGRQTAMAGRRDIARMVAAARSRIVVMAGSGIDERNVRQVMAATGVKEIHVGLTERAPGPMKYRNEKIDMGSIKGHEYDRFGLAQRKLENLLAVLHGSGARVSVP